MLKFANISLTSLNVRTKIAKTGTSARHITDRASFERLFWRKLQNMGREKGGILMLRSQESHGSHIRGSLGVTRETMKTKTSILRNEKIG